jgi:hypothetical protein
MKIHTLSGIRTRDPTKEEAADRTATGIGTVMPLFIIISRSIMLYDIQFS